MPTAPDETHFVPGRPSPGRKMSTPNRATEHPRTAIVEEEQPIVAEDATLGSYFRRLSMGSALPTAHNEEHKGTKKGRSRSLNEAQRISISPATQDAYLGIKTVYLKGLFSVSTTSNKPPMVIRNIVQQYLMLNGIRFVDERSYFSCTYRDSVSGPGRECVVFEVHIVRIGLIGLYGVQFKRQSGDIHLYKSICSQIIAGIRL